MADPTRLTEAQRRLLVRICEGDGDACGKRRPDRRTLSALLAKGMLCEGGLEATPQPTAAAFAVLDISQRTSAARRIDEPSQAAGSRKLTGDDQRPQTKRQLLLSLLERPDGASLAELQAAVLWQAHSVRGFLSGTVRKRFELSTFVDHAGHRRYRLGGELRG